MKEFITIRTNGTYPLYMGIAINALMHFDKIEKASDRNRMTHEVFCQQRVERQKHYSVLIVFSGMCIESFLYDYLAHEFGDDWVKNNIDSLRFLEKCAVYPRLVTGQFLDRNSTVWDRLVLLNRERNELVHSKSSPPFDSEESESKRKLRNYANNLPATAHKAISAIPYYAKQLQSFHQIAGTKKPLC